MPFTIDGVKYGWTHLNIALPSIGIQELTTLSVVELPEVAQERKAVQGSGAKNIGYSEGFVTNGEGSLEIGLEEFDSVILPGKNPLIGGTPFPITISYRKPNGVKRKVELLDCTFTKWKETVTAGSDQAKVMLSFACSDVKVNGLSLA